MPNNNNRQPLGVEASKALKLAHEAALDTWISRKNLPKPTIHQLKQEYAQLVLKTASVLAFVVQDASEDVSKPVQELTEATSTFLQALYNWCGADIAQHQTSVANMIKTAATNVEYRVAEFITAAMQSPVPPNLNVFVGKIGEVCALACATPPNNIAVAIRQLKIAVKQIESARQDLSSNNEILMEERLAELHALFNRLLDHILAYFTAVLTETEQFYENSISNNSSSSSSSSSSSQFPDDLGQRAVSNLSQTVDHLASEIDIIDVITDEDVSNIMIRSDVIISLLDTMDKLVRKAGFERREVIDVRFAVLELREYAKQSILIDDD